MQICTQKYITSHQGECKCTPLTPLKSATATEPNSQIGQTGYQLTTCTFRISICFSTEVKFEVEWHVKFEVEWHVEFEVEWHVEFEVEWHVEFEVECHVKFEVEWHVEFEVE